MIRLSTRSILFFSLTLLACFGIVAFWVQSKQSSNTLPDTSSHEAYAAFLNEHPFNNRDHEIESEEAEALETDNPELAWEQDFLRTMNPALGRPTPEVLASTIMAMNNNARFGMPGSSTIAWTERGPNNVGGRTRVITFDPNDPLHKKVWAGGVNGGLWYNLDITDPNSSWIPVNDFWANLSISSIAFDPNNSSIAYIGTGESYTGGWTGNNSGNRGAGIWKTTNGGVSWSQISSTTGFYYVNDVIVRNESGTSVVYAAADGAYYNGSYFGSANAGVQRSTNGGSSWTQVMPLIPSTTINFVIADLEIGPNNRIWAGSKASPYGATDRGGGRVLYSDNGTTWTTSSTTTVTNGNGRVDIATAPSNANRVYAMVENNNTISTIIKTANGGTSWTAATKPVDADQGVPSTDFSRGQGWYDLSMAVDPNNDTTLVVAAIDIFRSTNGGSTWTQVSKWSNNANMNTLSCSIVHSDHHYMSYVPGSSLGMVFCCDGGIYYASNISTAATSSTGITTRNKDYNVTQFYSCAMHPTSASNVFLAGAQDNGTQRFTTTGMNSTTDQIGGDGAYCFIDQTNGNYQIGTYVYNNFYRSSNNGVSFPTTLISDNNSGRFINPSDYDDNMDILYTAKSTTALYRVSNVTTTPSSATSVTITGMSSYASNIKVSPYTTSSTTLFIGTEAGTVYKVTNANATPTVTNITGSLPAGTISCVEIGSSENELLVTYFNYGLTSVWYTSNGGTTWVSKEGNLPDMPVRWALFNPFRYSEVLLATELGVWASTDISVTSPNWVASNNGLANVRVDMLQMRTSDYQVLAATHGRGLFSCYGFGAFPNPGFIASKLNPCQNQAVALTDTTQFSPTSWNWTITPSTFTFVSGTSATSQNPIISFSANGTYSISLTAGNIYGLTSITRTNYITVSNQVATITPSGPISICPGSSTFLNANTGTGLSYQWRNNGVTIPGATSATITVSNPGFYKVVVTNAAGCSDSSAGVSVSNYATPSPTNLSVSGRLMLCSGDSVVLSTAAGNRYRWTLNGSNTANNADTFNTLTVKTPGTYNVLVTNGFGCSSYMRDTFVTSSNVNTWTGQTSTAWGTATNWGCGRVPNILDSVAIASGLGNQPIISDGGRAVSSITIGPANTLTLNNNASYLSIANVLTIAGTMNNTLGTVAFVGSTPQNVPALNFNNLVINNNADVTLTGSVGVTGTLTLTNGRVNIGNNNLVLIGSTSSIFGGNSANFIITNGTGTLRMQNMGAGGRTGYQTFPVGFSAGNWTPVAISNTGTQDEIGVRMLNFAYTNGLSGTVITNNAVSKTWVIDENVAGGSNASVVTQWLTTHELSGFNRNACYVARYNGSNWLSTTPTAAVLSGFYTQTRTGLTQFGPFGVASGGTLPVELLSFDVNPKNSKAYLQWTTASERNSAYFQVERSIDAVNFNSIGKRIKAAGNSNVEKHYQLVDDQITSLNASTIYYRLKQVDVDGEEHVCKVISLALSTSEDFAIFSVQPNPFGQEFELKFNCPSAKPVSFKLMDLNGKLIWQDNIDAVGGTQTYRFTRGDLLGSGAYFIQLSDSKSTLTQKVIKQGE